MLMFAIRKHTRKNTDESGAAMLEFTLGLGLFITIVGLIIELGVNIYHKNLVDEATMTASDMIRMEFAHKKVPGVCKNLLGDRIDRRRCSDLERCAEIFAADYTQRSYGLPLDRLDFEANLIETSSLTAGALSRPVPVARSGSVVSRVLPSAS